MKEYYEKFKEQACSSCRRKTCEYANVPVYIDLQCYKKFLEKQNQEKDKVIEAIAKKVISIQGLFNKAQEGKEILANKKFLRMKIDTVDEIIIEAIEAIKYSEDIKRM